MVVAWSADHQHEDCTLSHDRQVRNPVYGQNLFRPNRKPATTPTLFTTRPVSPNTNNQCRGETFFAQIATSNTAYLFATRPVSPNTTNQRAGEKYFPRISTSNSAYLFATRPVSPNTTNQCRGEILFARIANHHHRIPCTQPDPSAPTSSANVRAKNISPLQHTTDPPYPGYDPTIVPNTAGHRRRAMCWGYAAAPAATPLSCQINLNHNWR